MRDRGEGEGDRQRGRQRRREGDRQTERDLLASHTLDVTTTHTVSVNMMLNVHKNRTAH